MQDIHHDEFLFFIIHADSINDSLDTDFRRQKMIELKKSDCNY